MDHNTLFNHYLKTETKALPRDVKELEGQFVIRRARGGRPFVCGVITKASANKGQFQIRGDEGEPDWCALAALMNDVVLLHSRGDMQAIFNCLMQQWQEDQRAADVARFDKEEARGNV